MMRHCVGTDPNLILVLHRKTELGIDVEREIVPCKCGMIFDDVEREVVYPHNVIGPKPTPDQVIAFFEGRMADELITTRHDPGPSLCLEEVTTKVGIRSQPILHVCTRYSDHAPDRKHICSCEFTWEGSE